MAFSFTYYQFLNLSSLSFRKNLQSFTIHCLDVCSLSCNGNFSIQKYIHFIDYLIMRKLLIDYFYLLIRKCALTFN